MVFIKDAKKEFLDQILDKRVLVFVHLDVDALCAWKIFQHLLHCEHVLYTVLPVTSKQALEDAYNQHRSDIKNIILINCGAGLDLVDILQPPEDAIFYLIDTMRPFEVRNVYNGVQIKIIVLQNELGMEQKIVPEFDDIFDEDEEGDEEKENEDGEGEDDDESNEGSDEEYRRKRGKRRRYDNEYVEKMHKKREWEKKRSKVLFEYYKYTYHRCSSSMVLFDLAWKTAKDNNDLLWWCIVGVSDQYVNARIDNDLYTRYIVDLHSHVLRHNHRPNAQSSTSNGDDLSVNCLKITQIDDLNMTLLRHWSILESINHSIDLSCLFKMWTNKGKKKLNEFLADLGLPLTECKQKYAYMDSSFKNDFRTLIGSETIKEKYRYEEGQLYTPTFIASFGYCNKLSAIDMTYIIQALIEQADDHNSVSDRFIEGLNCLNRENLSTLEKGIDLAIMYFKRVFQQLQNFIDMNQIVASGPFLQVFLEEGSQDNIHFSQFLSLKLLSRYALQSYLALTKGKKVRNLPLIVCVPLNETSSLITGIPPYKSSNNTENCFGLAFDEAAERTKSRVNFVHFDTSTIEINNEDKSKFLDALVAVLQ